MADMVASALAQEGVSRASSFISAKLEDKASSVQNLARLEMALSQLEFALERIAKMPITYLSLLRRVRLLKRAYAEGTALLNKHRPTEGRQGEARQAATRFSFLEWIGRARNLPISTTSLLGLLNKDHLSSSAVQMFEWYADCAEKLVADVETGCPVRRDTFCYPFVRMLLEGKALWYERIKGNQRMWFHMMPLGLGDRGVEAKLFCCYQDLKTPEKNFDIELVLRLSESTDIVGIAIKYLQLVTSQFKLAIESAVGELTLLPGLQDISHSHAPPLDCIPDATFDIRETKYWRPDPTCCDCDVDGPSSNTVPEPVIYIGFGCWISTPEYKPRSARARPLYMEAGFAPHAPCSFAPSPAEIVREYGGKEESSSGSMQQMEEVIRSNALDYLVHEPEPTDYALFWFAEHGCALFVLCKTCNEEAWPWPKRTVRGRSGGKRKR